MTFYYKGLPTTDLGEHYMLLARSGFMRDAPSKKIVLDRLATVSSSSAGLPVGSVMKIEKLYRMTKGYEPGAPFRHGDLAEVWTLRLKAHGDWYDPKTGKAKPPKWETIDHVSRSRSGEDFKPHGQKPPKGGFHEFLHGKSAKHERGDNPSTSGGYYAVLASGGRLNSERFASSSDAVRFGNRRYGLGEFSIEFFPGGSRDRAARHESGRNPRVARRGRGLNKYGRKEPTLRQLASTYSKPKAGTSWAKATLAERRAAYRLAYPDRDVGGWDLGFADKNAAKFLKVARHAKDHPRDPLSKRIRAVLGRGSES